MEVIKQIKMDLQNKQNVPVIDAVQGDGNTRVLEFSLYSGGVAWNVPDVVSVAVAYMRPDGAKGIYDTLADGSSAVSVSGNSVSAVIVPQAVSVDGDTKLTVVLTNDAGEQLATFSVVLRVEYNPAVGAVEPEDAASLWTEICETHAGTMDDPVPYIGNMALISGIYYIQDNEIYLCTRDTVNPVYQSLVSLVGHYVDIV